MKHTCRFQYLLILSGLLLVKPTTSFAQVAYDYDPAGNRTARRVISMPAKSPAKAVQAKPDSISEVLSGIEILAYPNPARETLNVEAKGLGENDEVHIFLFNSQGALVFRKESAAFFNPIDMSALAPGVYILRITAGGKKTEIKIIKQ